MMDIAHTRMDGIMELLPPPAAAPAVSARIPEGSTRPAVYA